MYHGQRLSRSQGYSPENSLGERLRIYREYSTKNKFPRVHGQFILLAFGHIFSNILPCSWECPRILAHAHRSSGIVNNFRSLAIRENQPPPSFPPPLLPQFSLVHLRRWKIRRQRVHVRFRARTIVTYVEVKYEDFPIVLYPSPFRPVILPLFFFSSSLLISFTHETRLIEMRKNHWALDTNRLIKYNIF